jgi:RNA polymerase sigma factor (sigma-70 family)
MGSELSFDELYESFAEPVFGYIARRLGPQLAEDLTAQAFAEAWACRGQFDPSRGSRQGWLFGIATNLIRGHRRQEHRQLKAYGRAAEAPPVSNPEMRIVERLAATDEWPMVARALSDLNMGERDVLWLHIVMGLPYADVADALGIPVGTVRSRLSRGRVRLAKAVEDATIAASAFASENV